MITFKEAVARDIHDVFLNLGEFAEEHTVNGKPMPVQLDESELLERDKSRVQREPPRKYSDAKSKSRRMKKYGPKADMTKIKKLLSPSVPHMLNNEAVRGPAEDLTYELLQAEIQRRIDKIKLG